MPEAVNKPPSIEVVQHVEVLGAHMTVEQYRRCENLLENNRADLNVIAERGRAMRDDRAPRSVPEQARKVRNNRTEGRQAPFRSVSAW